jgi:hypothetical protein
MGCEYWFFHRDPIYDTNNESLMKENPELELSTFNQHWEPFHGA